MSPYVWEFYARLFSFCLPVLALGSPRITLGPCVCGGGSLNLISMVYGGLVHHWAQYAPSRRRRWPIKFYPVINLACLLGSGRPTDCLSVHFYTPPKKKLLACSTWILKNRGVTFFGQCSHNYETLAIPMLPLVISKFENEKARSFFFGRVYRVFIS